MKTRSNRKSHIEDEILNKIIKTKKDYKIENQFLGKKRNKEDKLTSKQLIPSRSQKKLNSSLKNIKNEKKEIKIISKPEEKFLKIIHSSLHDQSTTAYTSDDEVFNDNFVDSLMSWPIDNTSSPILSFGLKNIGNTCFLNSVLQCILYTIPLKNYLNFSNHTKTCKVKGVCFICEYDRLQKQIGIFNYKLFI